MEGTRQSRTEIPRYVFYPVEKIPRGPKVPDAPSVTPKHQPTILSYDNQATCLSTRSRTSFISAFVSCASPRSVTHRALPVPFPRTYLGGPPEYSLSAW